MAVILDSPGNSECVEDGPHQLAEVGRRSGNTQSVAAAGGAGGRRREHRAGARRWSSCHVVAGIEAGGGVPPEADPFRQPSSSGTGDSASILGPVGVDQLDQLARHPPELFYHFPRTDQKVLDLAGRSCGPAASGRPSSRSTRGKRRRRPYRRQVAAAGACCRFGDRRSVGFVARTTRVIRTAWAVVRRSCGLCGSAIQAISGARMSRPPSSCATPYLHLLARSASRSTCRRSASHRTSRQDAQLAAPEPLAERRQAADVGVQSARRSTVRAACWAPASRRPAEFEQG